MSRGRRTKRRWRREVEEEKANVTGTKESNDGNEESKVGEKKDDKECPTGFTKAFHERMISKPPGL